MKNVVTYVETPVVNWHWVDWTLNDTEIARAISRHAYSKIHSCQVRYHRIRLGKEDSKRKWMRPDEMRAKARALEGVDWTRQDIELAREVGCTREYVRQQRRRLGKPDSSDKYKRTVKSEQRKRAEGAICNLKWDGVHGVRDNVTLSELSKMAGCSKRLMRAAAFRAGVTLTDRRKKYDWSSVDWSKRNGEIAKQLGCSRQAVASKRCYWVDK